MDPGKEMEEKLREAAGTGDEETVCAILDNGSVDVNSQHKINGWTPLHWAAHRGNSRIAAQLIKHGADKAIKTAKGETALQLASDPNTIVVLGGEPNGQVKKVKDEQSFVPNYLAYPPFPYISTQHQKPVTDNLTREGLPPVYNPVPVPDPRNNHHPNHLKMDNDELVIKARVANAAETDFIEVELDRPHLTFDLLVTTLCKELQVKRELIQKVRKLPNTILRKDKDVQRLKDLQEVELVLSNRAISESSRNYGPAVSPKHIDVVY